MKPRLGTNLRRYSVHIVASLVNVQLKPARVYQLFRHSNMIFITNLRATGGGDSPLGEVLPLVRLRHLCWVCPGLGPAGSFLLLFLYFLIMPVSLTAVNSFRNFLLNFFFLGVIALGMRIIIQENQILSTLICIISHLF